MADTYNANDPNNMGQNIAQGMPGVGILMMLRNLFSQQQQPNPNAAAQAMQHLGVPQQQRPPMPTPRDAMGRPLPIDPRTGQPMMPGGGR